jgi:Calpain family cysteine protease
MSVVTNAPVAPPVPTTPAIDLHVPSDLQQSAARFPITTSLARLQAAAGEHFAQVPAATVEQANSPTVVPNSSVARNTVGAANPLALAVLKSGVAAPGPSEALLPAFVERALGTELSSLVDPAHNKLIYPGLTLGTGGQVVAVENGAGAGGVGTGTNWVDAGHFFTDAAQFSDPIQGGLADCYFISAMASVAWAAPLLIQERTVPVANNPSFTGSGALDVISFLSGGRHDIDASELLPQQNGHWIYAHATDPSELWPGVYEKAFAMYKGNTTNQEPNYSVVNYGDPVAALALLTGGSSSYYATSEIITIPFLNITFDLISADQIWQTVRANSLGCRTVNPMVAWTYPSSAAAPTPINYGAANIVANHAYSVLGWDYQKGTEYIILRNPWGYYEATLNVEGGGDWDAWDISFWRQTPLSNGGVFGLQAQTFKQYFQGFGRVTFAPGTDAV